MTADVVDQTTGAGEPLAADEIRAMRERIDEIDQTIVGGTHTTALPIAIRHSIGFFGRVAA
jgi:hypothetical protein